MVTLAHVGRCGVPEPCPSFCPTQGELQFCGDDGVTYPRQEAANTAQTSLVLCIELQTKLHDDFTIMEKTLNTITKPLKTRLLRTCLSC